MQNTKMPVCSAVIVAAGSGSRMKQNINKVYMPLGENPVIYYSIKAFCDSPLISQIVVVTRECDVAECEQIVQKAGFVKVKCVVCGGATRDESVKNGICALDECDYVAVHDGARPLVTPEIIDRVAKCAFSCDGAIAAMPVKDTIKVSDGGSFIQNTPERSLLYSAQTPQIIKKDVLVEGFDYVRENGICVTDDASVAEAIGKKIALCEGSYENIKITTPEDMEFAQKFLLR